MEKANKPSGEIINDSGIPLKPLYTGPAADPGMPGEFPFTRGIRKDMYRGKLWTMRQYAGFSSAEESNKRYHYLLKQGVMGLSVAFDLPTQIGYDSDHPMAAGEVGKVGVAIDSLADFEILFEGINLEEVTTSMTINATASILLSMYIAVAKKQGADIRKISGTIQNDILKEYAARGTYIYPPAPSMRIITDIFEYCSREVPKWNTISISGYHIREAGSTAAQELAFTLSNGKSYVEAALKKGLDINVFGQRLSFFFNAHNDFFEEIAKFRAARKMWAQIMKDLGATDERAMMLRFHTQTAGSTLTAQQPKNNIVRVAIQAMAAVLGGTQSLHTNGFDEAIALPTEKSASIALRTQQIVGFESGISSVVDPMGGSYYIEELTSQLEQKAKSIMDTIDAMGGSVRAIEEGYIQQQIAEASYQWQRKMENGEKIIVGVNRFVSEEFNSTPVLKISDEVSRNQTARLAELKNRRDNAAVQLALVQLEQCASGGDNLMPYILDAVEKYATLGEISDVLRKVFGEYRETN